MRNFNFRKLVRNLRLGKNYAKTPFRRNDDSIKDREKGSERKVQPVKESDSGGK